MKLENQLNKVKFEVAAGARYKAAERLRILISQYPDDPNLRSALAQLYYDGGFEDAAGLYWLLIEPVNQEMIKAVEVYKESVKHSEYKMLQDVKFRGNVKLLPPYSKAVLNGLMESTGAKGASAGVKRDSQSDSTNRLVEIGCVAAFIIFILIFLSGLFVIVDAITNFFRTR